jgi:hypothetical protein
MSTSQFDWTRLNIADAPAHMLDVLAEDATAVWVHDASGYSFEESPKGYTVLVLNYCETFTSLDAAQRALEEQTDGFQPL